MNFKNEFVLWGERHFLISQISERCVLSHTYTHLEKGNTYSYLCFINAHCFAFGKTTNHLIARLCLAGNFNHFHTLLDLFCVCVCVCVYSTEGLGATQDHNKTLYIIPLLKHNPQVHICI